jgi:tyrosyl-tRNA synthetase
VTAPPPAFRSAFLSDMTARGHVYQVTEPEALDALCADADAGGAPPVAYIGFDATARSLHVGSLVQIMALRRLQRAGGKPIVLMGGGTTRIGDPTDKEKSRPLLSDAEIADNLASIRRCFEPFLRFGDGPTDALMVNNADWLDHLNYIGFLRDYGRHFTINRMIAQETVARRLRNEEPYTFLEFNYALLQAYDFLELFRRHGCRLQMGGSDQWGNIVNGVELTRRAADGHVFGLTTPLITTASGGKMGKTAEGAVWLNADLRAPYDYWQFWRNTEDADVGRFLRLFTDLPLEEIAALERLEGAAINDAKARLADEATAMLHGADAARAARAAAEAVFVSGQTGEGMPTLDVARGRVAGGLAVVDALVEAGLADSRSEAKRALKAASVRLNGETVTDEAGVIGLDRFDDAGAARLSVGRKRHARLRLA